MNFQLQFFIYLSGTDLAISILEQTWNIILANWPLHVCSVVSDTFETPWTGAHQAPLSMGLPRQEYWSVLPFPTPEYLPNPGIKRLLHWQADSLPLHHLGSPNADGQWPIF